MKFTTLDESFAEVLACPQCKGGLDAVGPQRHCAQCGRLFARNADGVWNFMLSSPPFATSTRQRTWQPTQQRYEEWAFEQGYSLSYEQHVKERDTVMEVYGKAFDVRGRVLDVGGHQGRLRHFLRGDTTYLSVDPFADLFRDVESQEALLRAYPCLREPCNLVQAQAEFLPIRSESFDYVHMRSVVDHLFDPTLALYEARRVLVPSGCVLIGLSVTGGASTIQSGSKAAEFWSRTRRKLRYEGVTATGLGALRRIFGVGPKDQHLWHPTYEQLLELVAYVGFQLEKIYWQRPPLDHVVWVLGRRGS